ncbi:low molecular weight protein-tyrosine-phosphatase [Nakamurella sp. A5-74]|uniref:protein-tyrosine-phosphatase n=1 Tax=Nakamurella sp. A5-74 TaxID=3158264 RepID=A0AAU8DJZ9_9ACTN
MSRSPSETAPVRISVVCSGNICRSPIGEKVLQARFAEAGLADRVRISSAGTGDWHVGDGANHGAVAVLRRHGYPTDHAAQQILPADLADLDLVLVADRGHLRVLRRHAAEVGFDAEKIKLIRSFDDTADSDDVPDPYGRPDAEFEDVLSMLEAAAPGVIEWVRRELLTAGPTASEHR